MVLISPHAFGNLHQNADCLLVNLTRQQIEIKLATELEKELLIRDLASSFNFAQTHNIVSKLSKFTEFTTAQVNEIVEAAISNNQVSWIIDDPDIQSFLKALTSGRARDIKPENHRELQRLMAKTAKVNQEDDDEIPFCSRRKQGGRV